MTKSGVLCLQNVYKSFKSPNPSSPPLSVLNDITLKIDENEIVTLLGPSGCGKTTVLNIAAGFERPDRGGAFFKGNIIQDASAKRAVIFQSAVLFPWLTVWQNVAYGLRFQSVGEEEKREKCKEFIELVGLGGFEGYYPDQLSGGMNQRVALARVLVLEPEVLLMDEPFASIDAQNRSLMQELLLSISCELKPSILFITHDVEEALFISDRVFIMTELPGSIKYEISVPFPKPRAMTLFSEKNFVELREEVLRLLLPEAFNLSL